MKTCPYCAEEIQDAAVVCRWCGRDLPAPPTAAPATAATPVTDAASSALEEAVEAHAARGWIASGRTTRSVSMTLPGARVNHVLHAILSLLTAGIWLFGWLFVVMTRRPERRRILYARHDASLAFRDNEGPEQVYAARLEADKLSLAPGTERTNQVLLAVVLVGVLIVLLFAYAAARAPRDGFYDRFPAARGR